MSALDDRGNPISVPKPADIKRAGDSEDAARAHLAHHLRHAIRAESRRFSLFHVGWSVAAVTLWIAVQIIVSQAGLYRYPFVRPLVFFGGIIVLVLIGREITRRRVSRLVAATAVAEGICGQCCYSLESVPTDPDGRMTCPECGAAWSAERITRPFWLAPQLPQTFHEERVSLAQHISRLCFCFITLTPKPTTLIATDDRGRFVRTVDSRLLLAPAHRKLELGDERVRKLRRAARRRGWIPRVLLALPSLTIAGFASWGAIDLATGKGRDDQEMAIVLSVVLAIALAISVAVLLSHSFLPPTHTAHALAADKLCGSCIAPIDRIAADPDGCATCATCGAAWRIAPQTQP